MLQIISWNHGKDSAYEYQPDYYPNHLETGTSNVSGIAGLREAIKFLNKEQRLSIEGDSL